MHFCICILLLISFDYLGRMTDEQILQAWNFNANLCHFFPKLASLRVIKLYQKAFQKISKRLFYGTSSCFHCKWIFYPEAKKIILRDEVF